MPEINPASATQAADEKTQIVDLPRDQEFPEGFSQREPVCEESPYPRYEPGTYDAECLAANTYKDPRFRAWKCRLRFQLLPNGDGVFGFLHLGRGDQPKAGPGSEYRRAWIIANGNPPRKRQTLSNRVFKKKIFQVRIGDTTRRFDGRTHPDGQVYSTVKEILSRIYP